MAAKLFMDCGAFSAWNKGAAIDIEAYCRFLLHNRQYIEVAAALDVIGDAEGTYRNFMRMKELGVDFAIPTFHVGGDLSYLERYIKECSYLALGGIAFGNERDVAPFLERAWDMLTDQDGYPLLKVHGFACTSTALMSRWPWYSVDSSSWIMAAASGKVFFNTVENGQPNLRSLTISEKSPDADKKGWHYTNLLAPQRAIVDAWMERAGFTVEQLSTDYKARFECNAVAFVEYARAIKYHALTSPLQTGFFDMPTKLALPAAPAWDHLTFYLAGNPGPQEMTYRLMTKRQYSRLISYYYVEKDKHFTAAKQAIDEGTK